MFLKEIVALQPQKIFRQLPLASLTDLDHGDRRVVVTDPARHAAQVFKRQSMPFQKGLRTLTRKDLHEDRAAGGERAMLYRVAAGTGFRLAELRSLAPTSFDVDANPPTVTVERAYSKRRRRDVQPIRLDLAERIRQWLPSLKSRTLAFSGLNRYAARMLAADLQRAREAWIAAAEGKARVEREKSDFLKYETDDGFFDFHAHRHQYISGIVASGATVKTAQELARHSTPTLTIGRYSHARLHDLTAALDALPAEEKIEKIGTVAFVGDRHGRGER